mmetsp:Transcript_2573/g.3158  ORF Transcript_2573/g.3158 Transcript_2573/m.3158 type:complete len:94 (-) Transcript_2573:489-770(-)
MPDPLSGYTIEQQQQLMMALFANKGTHLSSIISSNIPNHSPPPIPTPTSTPLTALRILTICGKRKPKNLNTSFSKILKLTSSVSSGYFTEILC